MLWQRGASDFWRQGATAWLLHVFSFSVLATPSFGESADCSDAESDDESAPVRGNRFNAERTNIRYKNLVDLVRIQFFREFSLATEPAWFQRIACWCARNGISLRTPNRTIPRNPLKVAREVYRCVTEVNEVREGLKDLLPCEICNFDETAIQIFALWINISGCPVR